MWEQIQANRRRSAVFLSCMMSMLLILGYILGEAIAPGGGGWIGLPVAAGILAIQMLVYLTAAESILLGTANAHELQREDYPQLFNIVEEMKIASGLPFLPRVFLIDEATPNAFAVGRKPEKSAVAVTTGLVHRLNRDELQGVIGHEIGHLKNHDVQFLTLAAILLGSIVMLTDAFWRILRGVGRSSSRSRERGGGQVQAVLFLAAIVCAILAPILAQLLYFACSRRREYLADASSAQFTRYPEGLASALEKIAGAQQSGAEFANRTTAPMFIVNPLQASDGESLSLFSTHPPTAMRVKILRNMGGAGLGDYEAAFRQLKGGGVIGPTSLQESPHAEARAASVDAEEGLHMRDARAVTARLSGYIPVTCTCGLTTRVPQSFTGGEVRCVRCGNLLQLPIAQPMDTNLTKALGTTAMQPLTYQRKTSGWESVRCACGNTLQISPSFRAPHVKCNKCGRQIEVLQATA